MVMLVIGLLAIVLAKQVIMLIPDGLIRATVFDLANDVVMGVSQDLIHITYLLRCFDYISTGRATNKSENDFMAHSSGARPRKR